MSINFKYILLFTLFCFFSGVSLAGSPLTVDIAQTVVKKPVNEDVSLEEVVESMKLRANLLNIKLVAELPLSKQIEAMGKKSRFIGIYQFCEPLTAKLMVEYDINFAAYLPCRISLVEDKNGKAWLLTMNLDMLIRSAGLNKELRKEAVKIRDNLYDIMKAGASGDL